MIDIYDIECIVINTKTNEYWHLFRTNFFKIIYSTFEMFKWFVINIKFNIVVLNNTIGPGVWDLRG